MSCPIPKINRQPFFLQKLLSMRPVRVKPINGRFPHCSRERGEARVLPQGLTNHRPNGRQAALLLPFPYAMLKLAYLPNRKNDQEANFSVRYT